VSSFLTKLQHNVDYFVPHDYKRKESRIFTINVYQTNQLNSDRKEIKKNQYTAVEMNISQKEIMSDKMTLITGLENIGSLVRLSLTRM